MHTRQAFAFLGLAALATLPLTGPSLAASAIASDPISIWAGPHTDDQVVGRLLAGEAVSVDRCTESGRWCLVRHDGPSGWVPAGYLVGAAAKVEATPQRSLTDPPIDREPTRTGGNYGLW